MKKKNSLTMMAYREIKDMMLRHDIRPGQRLILADLAAKLGFSRTPVNNALSMLTRDGYLDFFPNRGFAVHRLTRQEADDLCEARESLEICTIGKAIRLMTEEDIAHLRQAKNAFEHAAIHSNPYQLSVADTEFHAGIIAMTGNQYMVQCYLEICWTLSLRLRLHDLEIQHLQEITLDHSELFEAVSLRDVETAKVLIKRHRFSDREVFFTTSLAKALRSNALSNVILAT